VPQANDPSWIVPVAHGLRLAVRLQPGAGKSDIGGAVTRADGVVVLRAWVTAAPEGGKANAALIALLAKAWRLPKGSLEIVSGHTGRNKTLFVAGDPATLEAKLAAWMRQRGDGGKR